MARSKGENAELDPMRRVLYFHLGDKERMSFGTLLATFQNIRGILADLDAAVSRDPRGTVRWEVVVLRKDSPPLLGVTGYPVKRRQAMPVIDHSRAVEDLLVETVTTLSEKAQRPEALSDSALKRVQRLARQTRSMGPIRIASNGTTAPINEHTLDNIRKITGAKHQSVGSILGKLDTISVHRTNEVRVWDENTSRSVSCRYPFQLEETMKAYLRERVLVSGVVSYNEMGQAISVEVSDIERYARADELPTIEQVSGIIDDLTGGLPLGEYMDRLRDE